MIAAGGAGKVNDVYDVITQGKADAVSLASILHYNYVRHYRATNEDYSEEGNTEFLKNVNRFSMIKDTSLADIKTSLVEHNVQCRWPIADC